MLCAKVYDVANPESLSHLEEWQDTQRAQRASIGCTDAPSGQSAEVCSTEACAGRIRHLWGEGLKA